MMNEKTGPKSQFPVRLFAFALILTSALLIALSCNAYQSYRNARSSQERDLRLQELRGDLLYFDEVLTMSARMAAATGDVFWTQRYEAYRENLVQATTRAAVPMSEPGAGGVPADFTRTRLLEIEKLGLFLIRAHRVAEAAAILGSEEYEEQKRLYIRSINRLSRSRAPQVLALELRDVIVYLDEVLTMSTRLAAVTGDLIWEQRYRSFEPQLDAAIQQAKKVNPDFRPAAEQTEMANDRLVRMENEAFALVRQGRAREAVGLVFSQEYEAQKEIYAEGMSRFTQLLRDHARQTVSRSLLATVSSIAAVGLALLVLIFAWVALLRTLHQWRLALLGANRDLARQTEELGRANTVLVDEITQRRRAQDALAEQAIRDSLTHLYNRRYFNARMPEELARSDRQGDPLAVLICDLDRFKSINDDGGHQKGDEVLKAVAKSVLESTRGADLVFRWGGDEIVIVLSSTDRSGILAAGERIRAGAKKGGQQLGVETDISIGIAVYPEHGSNSDQLIRIADRALYIAKKGGDKIHIGDEEYRLDQDMVKVVFQPVFDVRRNRVVGHEALSRDAQSKLSIQDLFKRYQAIGQLNELKCLCFRLQIQAAERVGLERVFLNVDFRLLNQLRLIPKPAGLQVILEISEVEALRDVQVYLRVVQKWREAGYGFAIDDFGAGFISLPFIARAVPNYIKLDRSTVLQAVQSDKFRKFSKDLIRALRNYSREGVIAEGVETEKELRIVRALGIDLVQGYLLGRPVEL